MDRVILAGGGPMACSALKSLQEYFSIVELCSEDEDVRDLVREKDTFIEDFRDSPTSLVVCMGYNTIISKETLETKTIINNHPALLPKYRGSHGLVWSMLNFEKELGFTIHLMNEFIDDGDILEQYKFTYENQTSNEAMSLFDAYIRNNLGRVVKDFTLKKITPIKQDRSLATWVTRRNYSDCVIDFDSSEAMIHRLFRVLVRPYPLPMLRIKNKLYEIDGYKFKRVEYFMHLGRVVNIEGDEVFIKTREGILIVNSLIRRKTQERHKAADLLFIGQRL
ncbi:MAG: hypothetical protein KC646_06230 [Candidatus Cloacimonetes bacterium]|nr:hypothetical protein [Candidatus Cloacimonadota bacterium]